MPEMERTKKGNPMYLTDEDMMQGETTDRTARGNPRYLTDEDMMGSSFTPMQSGLLGAAQGALMGYPDELESAGRALYEIATGPDELKDLLARYKQIRDEEVRPRYERAERENPGIFMAGMMGGGGASMLIPGVGLAKGAGALAKAGQAAAMGGLAGGGYSEADLTEGEVGDLATDVGIGAGIGGASQYGIDKLARGGAGLLNQAKTGIAEKATQKAAERAVKAATGQNIGALRKIAQSTHQGAGDIQKLEKGLRKVGEDIIEERLPSGKPLLTGTENVETLAPKLAETRKFYGGELGKVGKAVDAFYPQGAVDGKRMADRLRSYADELVPNEKGKALKTRIYKEAENLEGEGMLTFERAKDWKNQFKHKATDADILVSDQDVTNKIRNIIGTQMDETADALEKRIGQRLAQDVPENMPLKGTELVVRDEVIPGETRQGLERVRDLLGSYQKLKGKYGSFKQAGDAASDRALKNLSNRLVSPSDYGTGIGAGATMGLMTGEPITGAIVAALAGGANKLARERGSAAGAVTLRKIAEIAKSNPDFVQRWGNVFMKAAERGPAAMAATHAALLKIPNYRSQFETGGNQ